MKMAIRSGRQGRRRRTIACVSIAHSVQWLLFAFVLCGVLLGAAASASAAALPAVGVDKASDDYVMRSASIYGVRHAPVEHFLHTSVSSSLPRVFTFPSAYDLRTQNKLTPVKDQGTWGTCWTFATCSSLESCLLPGETWDFSENDLAWHAGYDWGFDDGGNYTMSTAYLSRWDGPVLETDDPYGSGQHDPAGFTKQKHVQDVLVLAPKQGTSFDEIKQALMTWGAIGTYVYWDNAYFNAATNSLYYPSAGSQASNHAVTIVGWDDSYPGTRFSPAAPGPGAFIIRNSWGPAWGDGGYFYCSYYDKYAGVDAWCFDGAESPADYSDVYLHDPLGCIDYWAFSNVTSIWACNVFTARTSEDIAAASVHTAYSGIGYEVWAGPTKETMTRRGSGTFAYAGYHTVDFSAPLAVASGAKFAVAFKLIGTASKTYLTPAEYPYAGFSSKATATAGQSFLSADGTQWEDVVADLGYADTNVCVKAFGTAGSVTPAPSIESVYPTSGEPGDVVTITGSELGTTGTVRFDSATASTSSWTASSIICTVPVLGPGQASVTVTTGGKTSNALSFTVLGQATDTTAPLTSVSSPDDLTRWHNHDVQVTFDVSDVGSGPDVLLYAVDVWGSWNELDLAVYDTLVFRALADHTNDGDWLLFYKARDKAGNVEGERSLDVMIDTRRPTGKAVYPVSVRKGRYATLKYEILDVGENAGTAANVKVVIKNRYGTPVKTFLPGTRDVNTIYAKRFRCTLPRGTYHFFVSGRDAAGNQARVGSNRLVVR